MLLLFVLCALGYFFFTKSADSMIKTILLFVQEFLRRLDTAADAIESMDKWADDADAGVDGFEAAMADLARLYRDSSPEYRSRPSAGDPTRLIGSPTTTIKAQHFLSTPLRDVALRDVPGVGIVVASKLEVNFRHPAPYPHLSSGSTCCPQLIRTRP